MSWGAAHLHEYIIGQSRTGKTNYILGNVEEPFCFIDKHGNAARELADAYPCIFWRPADLSHPIGYNPLQSVPPDQRWKVTADIVAIFSDIWGLGDQTPRLLYYLRASIRLLLDHKSSTLLDIRRVLHDADYRYTLLRKSTDNQTCQTWLEFNTKQPKQQAEEVASLQNKVAALAAPLPLQFMLAQKSSTIDFRKLIETKTNLCIDLSDLGDEPAALTGALIINAFKQAADTFTDPQPYNLIIDEFQNFGTSILSTILSESGKRGLNLVLAHQFISQLDDEIRDSVLGNCSTIVSFRLGANDAPIIAQAIDTSPQNLMDLARGQAFIRTLIKTPTTEVPSEATFTETKKAKLPTGFLERNIRTTHTKFARRRQDVERMLQ